MIDTERIMELVELVYKGVETQRVRVVAIKRKGKVESLRVTLPSEWAKELGIEPGDELLAIKDPESKAIIYVKLPSKDSQPT